VEAFRRAYPSDRRSRTTEWQGGKRVAGLQQVKDEVQRLTLLRSPHDAAAQTDHIVARLIELSKDANPEVALRAIGQWSKLAEAGLLKPPPLETHADQPFDRAQAIGELRRLYANALGRTETENELLAPRSAESQEVAGQVIDIEADDMPADVPMPLYAREETPSAPPLPRADQDRENNSGLTKIPEEIALKSDVWSPVGSPDDEEGHATTTPASAPYVMQRITPPGHFPPKFRRIPAT
jgi:hypothetical protein